MRSSTPPWPGNKLPESLTPAERLSADSARSPTCAAAFTTTAITSQYHQTSSKESLVKFHWASSIESQYSPPVTRTLPRTEPIAPAQVLLGLMAGANLRLPHMRPT